MTPPTNGMVTLGADGSYSYTISPQLVQLGFLLSGRADHGEVLDGLNTQDSLHPWEAAVLRFSPDGRDRTVYARGLRNPYDIAWDAGGTPLHAVHFSRTCRAYGAHKPSGAGRGRDPGDRRALAELRAGGGEGREGCHDQPGGD